MSPAQSRSSSISNISGGTPTPHSRATKCCAPQLPRQFGEGEPDVSACDIVPKTPVLFLKRSTKRTREHCMGQYAMRRALLFIPTLLLATIMVFALFWIVPGDPALTILGGGEGDSGTVSLEQLQQLRQRLGLDRPIYVQYMSWLGRVLHGDLGTSLWYKTPVWAQLKDRFLVTMELAVMAILLAFCA